MEQIHNIRCLSKFKCKSLRSIAKETGCHFNTVKKYIEKGNFNLKTKPHKQNLRKLVQYFELIDSWLESDLRAKPKQIHTAQQTYNRLKEQFPEFDFSDRSVRVYVSKRKVNGIFFDEKMTIAIVELLIHHSHFLVFSGPSYSLIHSSINC